MKYNKGNSSIVVIAGVAVVCLLVVGFVSYKAGQNSVKVFGSEIDNDSALRQIDLRNALFSLAADDATIFSVVNGMISGSGTASFGTISAGNATSTDITTTGAVVGDFAIASIGTSTSALFTYSAYVSGAGTTTVVARASTSVSLGAPTVRVRVLPFATFADPGSLITSTSTSN